MVHVKKHKRQKARSYGFLTTGSTLVEVTATNPRSAYKKAIMKIKKLTPEYRKFGVEPGDVTKSYVTYGKSGFVPVGIYKQVK